jgi:hypothetical protein
MKIKNTLRAVVAAVCILALPVSVMAKDAGHHKHHHKGAVHKKHHHHHAAKAQPKPAPENHSSDFSNLNK